MRVGDLAKSSHIRVEISCLKKGKSHPGQKEQYE